MQFYKAGVIFNHVEIMLNDLYGNNKEFDDSVVVFGYETIKNFDIVKEKYKNYRIIIYQMEQLYRGARYATNENINKLRKADLIWDYDFDNIDWLKKYCNIKPEYQPIIATESLKNIIIHKEKDIDILFYGYFNNRRVAVINEIQKKIGGSGKKIVTVFGAFGKELDNYLARSKIVLNIHSDDIHRQEQVRMFYPLANGIKVLSEKSVRNYFPTLIESEYKDLPNKAIELIY